MSCPECNKSIDKTLQVDRRGNVISGASMDDRPEKRFRPKELPADLKNQTYQQYIKEKSIAREYGKKIGNDAIKTFSTDHKRIQIKELIDVVNHEDGGPLSPTQALQALYDFSKLNEYEKIFDEFSGLKERVLCLYNKLIKDNKIEVEWKQSFT